MKKAISAAIALSMLLSFASCGRSPESSNSEQKIEGVKINLSDSGVTVDELRQRQTKMRPFTLQTT